MQWKKLFLLKLHLSPWGINLQIGVRLCWFLPRFRAHALPEELERSRNCLKRVSLKTSLDNILSSIIASMCLWFAIVSFWHPPWTLSSWHLAHFLPTSKTTKHNNFLQLKWSENPTFLFSLSSFVVFQNTGRHHTHAYTTKDEISNQKLHIFSSLLNTITSKTRI